MSSTFRDLYPLAKVASESLSEFRERAGEVLGIRFPTSYLQQADAYALTHEFQGICGGLIVVQNPPFRCLQSIPIESKWDVFKRLGDLTNCAEINGVWIAPEAKSAFVSNAFWRQMIDVLLASNKDRFLFTVDHSNRHMLGHVSFLQPVVLYSGATIQLDGMGHVANEVIFSIQRDSVEDGVKFLDRFETGQKLESDLEAVQRISKRRKTEEILAAYDQATQ